MCKAWKILGAVAWLVLAIQPASAQDLRKSGSVFGRIEDDGRIRIRGNVVGKFEANGDIRIQG
jgi:hypothetical protein